MVPLKEDIFILDRDIDRCLIYSPLRGKAFLADKKSEEVIRRYIRGEYLSEEERNSAIGNYLAQLEQENVYVPKLKSFNPRGITFVLSNRCNLDCSYCFAKEYRANVVLSEPKIERLVKDYFASIKRSKYVFTFIGGGEPTMTWGRLQYAIESICRHVPNDAKLCIAIVTNATLLTENRLAYLSRLKNIIHISVSFDVLPDIQNTTRKYKNTGKNTFEVVHLSLERLKELGISFSIRSTITKDNVHRQKEMVEFIYQNYSPKYIHFEPVTSAENTKEFYMAYVSEFMKAFHAAREYHIILKNSISNRWQRLNASFCNGELCVTPYGDIFFCHRMASIDQNSQSNVNYGYVTEENAIVDIEKHRSIVIMQKQAKCKSCFAQWICAGGCAAERQMPENVQEMHCDYVRSMITALMEYEINIKFN